MAKKKGFLTIFAKKENNGFHIKNVFFVLIIGNQD